MKYGVSSNHVLSIKAVLPDGEVVYLGGESLESVGSDFIGLYVGSEGTFGIALQVTLRLIPKPESYRTILASYASLEDAGNAVSQVVASGLLPGALEIMDSLAIQAAEAAVKANYPKDAAAVLIVELDGEAVQVEEQFKVLRQIIETSGASEIRLAQNDAAHFYAAGIPAARPARADRLRRRRCNRLRHRRAGNSGRRLFHRTAITS